MRPRMLSSLKHTRPFAQRVLMLPAVAGPEVELNGVQRRVAAIKMGFKPVVQAFKKRMSRVTTKQEVPIMAEKAERRPASLVQPGVSGVLASRTLSRGDCVLVESPLIVLNPARGSDAFVAAFDGLLPQQQLVLRSLCGLRPSHNTLHRPLSVEEAFEALSVTIPGSHASSSPPSPRSAAQGSQLALFPTLAHFQHSCSPNCNAHYEVLQGKLVCHVVADSIPAGGALTIAWVDVLQPAKRRQQALRERFGLDPRDVCDCEACLPQNELEGFLSDTRRDRLRHIFYRSLPRAKVASTALKRVQEGIALLHQERLWGMDGSLYYDAFQICVGVSDWEQARVWVSKAHLAIAAEQGETSAAACSMQRYAVDPSTSPAVGKFKQARSVRDDGKGGRRNSDRRSSLQGRSPAVTLVRLPSVDTVDEGEDSESSFQTARKEVLSGQEL